MRYSARSAKLLGWTILVFAIADLAPTGGKKRISYEVEVLAIPADSGMKLAIFPWSISNGVPSGEVKLVNVGEEIKFGRRINGDPKFWAVSKDRVAEIEKIRSDSGKDNFGMVKLLKAWFDQPGHAVECTGAAIKPKFSVEEDNPNSKQTDQFVVKSLSTDTCIVNFEGIKPTSEAVASEPKDSVSPVMLLLSLASLGFVCALVLWLCMRLQRSKQARDSDSLELAFNVELKEEVDGQSLR